MKWKSELPVVWWATALANMVLPHPGGPNMSTPLGGSMPICLYNSKWVHQCQHSSRRASHRRPTFLCSSRTRAVVCPQEHSSVCAGRPRRYALRVHDLLWTRCVRSSWSRLWSRRCRCFDRWPREIDLSRVGPIGCVWFLLGRGAILSWDSSARPWCTPLGLRGIRVDAGVSNFSFL